MREKNVMDKQACPICLHHCVDPTILDNCKHIFCFECITEWTRLKPECPLCKCALLKLKHKLLLKNGEKLSWSTEGKLEVIMELRGEYEMNQIAEKTSYPPDVEKHAVVQIVKSMMGELHSLRSLSITTYASELIYKKAIQEIEHELADYKRLLLKFNKHAIRADLFSEPAFRRIVYRKNLTPHSICTPMFNITFNNEYIKNHRNGVKAHLLPYIIREITALIRRDTLDIDTYVDKLLDYFSVKIKRQEIVTFLNAHGIDNPHHFLNNLFHFASAGQNLRVYDQNSEYSPRRSNYVENYFPEDDDVLILNSRNSDVEIIGERATTSRNYQYRQRMQPTDRTRLPNNNLPVVDNSFLLMNQNQQQQSSSNPTNTSNSLFLNRPDLRIFLDNISRHWSNVCTQTPHDTMNNTDSFNEAGTSTETSNIGGHIVERKRRKNDTLTLDDSDDAVQIVNEVQIDRSSHLQNENVNEHEDDNDLELMDECEN